MFRNNRKSSQKSILDGIDEINWQHLKHAYGVASDVAKDIRNLTNTNEKTRESALYNLYGSIFHQGTRYEATPYAIPFIYELIESEHVKNRHELIEFLINLALGYEDNYLPEGIDPKKFRKNLLDSEARLTTEQREVNEKYGYSILALIDCYNFVEEGISILLNCLKHEDESIRIAALYAIAWFPEKSENTTPAILEILSSSQEEMELATGILTLGLLSKQSASPIDLSVLQYHMNSDSALLRISAAIALARNPIQMDVLNILIEGIKSETSLSEVEGMLFNEGNISGYASLTLSKYGKSEKDKIIPVLCESLIVADTYQSLDITHALLEFINDKKTVLIKDEKLEDLNQLELLALNAIYEHGGWTVGGGGFVNYFNLLKSGGVPDSKSGLGEFLNKTDT
ncbi:MAG: HEAT repeat domain-containing protein [Cytophagales bacterium]|nr:HEAT repeat domain-containing protein [Cytophagales bacterium]